jgi:hypothetical protein
MTSRGAQFCPNCHAPPNVKCCSEVPVTMPSHPLDFTCSIPAMSRFPGEYTGTCTSIVAMPSKSSRSAEPTRYVSATLATNTRLRGYALQDTRHKDMSGMFLSFAVKLSITDRSPTRAVMPRANPDPAKSKPFLNTDVLDSEIFGAPRAVESKARGLALGAAAETANAVNFSGSNETDVPLIVDDVPAAGSYGSQPDIVVTLPSGATQTPARRETLLGCPPPSGQVSAEHLDRVMRRKLKNRRSAARSNARKRERREALMKDLQEANQVALELRHQETKLRAENMALRRRLSDSSEGGGDTGKPACG